MAEDDIDFDYGRTETDDLIEHAGVGLLVATIVVLFIYDLAGDGKPI